MWNDPLRRKSKMAQYWIYHLQNFNNWYSSVVYLWVGTWGQSRIRVGCGCISKELSFCIVVPAFLIKLEGPKLAFVRMEWSSCLMFCYSMWWIYHTEKLQLYWLFDEKTGQRVKKMQLSERTEIIPWNCHKIKLQLEINPSNHFLTYFFFRALCRIQLLWGISQSECHVFHTFGFPRIRKNLFNMAFTSKT